MEYRIPKKGECYRHFKGNRYQVLAVASHTETSEQLVIYEGLYGDHPVYARPLEMFTGKVDKDKFPDVKQEYRFELEEETAVPDTKNQEMIMEFLDLDTKEEKLQYLQQRRLDITESFLSAAAISLDFVENQTSLDGRFEDLVYYLRTLMRYEIGRRI